MKRKLSYFLKPKSIAIVGASETQGKVGHSVMYNVSSTFKGEIYPINPKKEEILGLKAYSSISNKKDVKKNWKPIPIIKSNLPIEDLEGHQVFFVPDYFLNNTP